MDITCSTDRWWADLSVETGRRKVRNDYVRGIKFITGSTTTEQNDYKEKTGEKVKFNIFKVTERLLKRIEKAWQTISLYIDTDGFSKNDSIFTSSQLDAQTSEFRITVS